MKQREVIPGLYDPKELSDATAIWPVGESLTVQSQSEEADINVLMYRYGITGKFPDNPYIPTFQEFTDVVDFRTALHAIQNAHNRFMEYPANIRARFENNPQLFLDFCSDPGNVEEMRKLGFLKESVSGSQSVNRGAGSPGAAEARAPGGSGVAQGGTAAGALDSGSQSDGSGGQAGPASAV